MGCCKIDITYLTDDCVRKTSVFCIDDLQSQLVPMSIMGYFILCLLLDCVRVALKGMHSMSEGCARDACAVRNTLGGVDIYLWWGTKNHGQISVLDALTKPPSKGCVKV